MSEATDADAAEDDWRELADALHEQGGVPERRAEVVAVIATGHTHREAVEMLDLPGRYNVSTHLDRYRDSDLPEARWLAEHGPEI